MNEPRGEFLIRVANPVKGYAWGSPTAIPDLLGTPASGEPQAEMWLGAHPADPSMLVPAGVRLDAHLSDHPGLLGASASAPARLPFLMKVLAAAMPLSLQVHPTADQARAGFARDEAAGLGRDDPRRSYRDDQHKPEIIVAISDFRALCGFREPATAGADLADLLGASMRRGVGAELAAVLAGSDARGALRGALRLILSGRREVRTLAAEASVAADGSRGGLADTLRIVGSHFGDDPGVLGAALLNRVDLAPGEALYLDAGNIHAYLSGLGIEAMAPSDNVLRGGLTTKHVDVDGLLEIVAFTPVTPHRVPGVRSDRDGVSLTSYHPPALEFSVHAIDVRGGPRRLDGLTGPSMLIVTEGSLVVRSGDEEIVVERGQSVFQAAGPELVVGSGGTPARAFLTTVGGRSRPADASLASAQLLAPGAISTVDASA